LQLAIRDDGIGGADPQGSGLIGLSDRIEAVGGTLAVSSQPGDGTHIRVEIPLSTETAQATKVDPPHHEGSRLAS
jgi:signal transduction histidine kinase